MLDILIETLKTPFLPASLGFVIALSLFVSPILYNGDYKAATKSVVIVAVYALITTMLICSNITFMTDHSKNVMGVPIMIQALVSACYIIGLYLGVFIHNRINKH